MVINKTKTELVVFDNKSQQINLVLSDGITSSKEMKGLGVTFTSDLKCDKHINNIVGKTSGIVNKVNFLRCWIVLGNEGCYLTILSNVVLCSMQN